MNTLIFVFTWLAQNVDVVVAALALASAVLEAAGFTKASKLIGTWVPDGGRIVRRMRDTLISLRLWWVARNGAPLLLLALALPFAAQACSLEAARARGATPALTPREFAAEAARDGRRCDSLDTIHLWGDWSAGVLGAASTASLGVATSISKGPERNALIVTGAVTAGASLMALGIGEQSAASWAERCK